MILLFFDVVDVFTKVLFSHVKLFINKQLFFIIQNNKLQA